MNVYEIDTQIQITGEFLAIVGGAPVAPTDVELYLLAPDGTEQTITTGFGNPSVGIYTYVTTPSLGGIWAYKWRSPDGAVIATGPDTVFLVNASMLIPS